MVKIIIGVKGTGKTKTLIEMINSAKKLIEGGDPEANYAFYALMKLHMLPSVFLNLDRQEKAFIIASVQLKIKAEKEEAAKLK